MGSLPRSAAVREHLVRGGSVCPWAGKAARRGLVQFVEVPPGANLQPCLWEGAKRFCATWRKPGDHALVVVAADDPPDFEAGRRLATLWQMEILLAFNRVTDPRAPVAEVVAHTCAQNQAHLLDRNESEVHALPCYAPAPLRREAAQLKDPAQRAALLAFEGGVYLLFAGPQYGAKDLRFAPHFCAVMTWGREVYAAQQNEAAMRYVRDAMVQQYGGMYDAEAPYLELCPVVTAPGPRASAL